MRKDFWGISGPSKALYPLAWSLTGKESYLFVFSLDISLSSDSCECLLNVLNLQMKRSRQSVRWREVTQFVLFLYRGHGCLTTGCISKRNEVTVSRSHLHSRAHYSTIHVRQDLDTVKLSINPWSDKENVVHAHSRILFSHIRSEILSSHGKCTVFSTKGFNKTQLHLKE